MSDLAKTCLFEDFCDAWRLANNLVDEDYAGTNVRKYHCPRLNSAKPIDDGYNLRYCYSRREDGWRLIYDKETRNAISSVLPDAPSEI